MSGNGLPWWMQVYEFARHVRVWLVTGRWPRLRGGQG